MSSNRKAVVVSGILVYEVKDVVRVLTSVHDVDDVALDVGRAVIAEVITGEPLNGLLDGLRDQTLTKILTKKVRAKLKRYGIHVIRASLNEIAPCTVVRMVGETSQTVAPLPDPD